MLHNELTALRKASELVTVTLEAGVQSLTGIIHMANNRVTALVLYSDEGEYQGWTFFETSLITQLYWGNREHQAIASLVDNSFKRVLPLNSKASFSASVVELGRRLECIGLCIYGEEEGLNLVKIVESGNEWLKVLTYGSKSTLSQGWKMIPLDEVCRIEVDSPYINKTSQLHKADF